MRILASSFPAVGHLLPLAPLLRAAADIGHEVTVIGAPSLAPVVAAELPACDFFPAGPEAGVVLHDAAGALGLPAPPAIPSLDMVAETFAGSRMRRGFDEARDVAARVRPDVILSESYDTLGPALAAVFEIDWYEVTIGPVVPPFRTVISSRLTAELADRGLRPVPSRALLDRCPDVLQTAEWEEDVPRIRVRPEAHRRSDRSWMPPTFEQSARPTVLVTLGTTFASPGLLDECLQALRDAAINVIATTGHGEQAFVMDDDAVVVTDDDAEVVVDGLDRAAVDVVHVDFVPLDELLDIADLVVTVGGVGTVLGALARGVPMVVWPQGAEQPLPAELLSRAGLSAVIAAASELASAVRTTLDNPVLRAACVSMAQAIAATPSAGQVVRELFPAE